MKQKVIVNTYSEDFATNTEVVIVEGPDKGKVVERLYIGATTWDYNSAQARKEKSDFMSMINEKYENVTPNYGSGE